VLIQFVRLPVEERPELFLGHNLSASPQRQGYQPGASVWMADTEVSLDLFELFLDETSDHDHLLAFYLENRWLAEWKAAQSGDTAAIRISWPVALHFNRWLESKLRVAMRAAPELQAALAEDFGVCFFPPVLFHRAAAAGSTAGFPFASSPRAFERLLPLLDVSRGKRWPKQRSSVPNGLGLFDMSAGCRELSDEAVGRIQNLQFTTVGGCHGSETQQLAIGSHSLVPIMHHITDVGHRPLIVTSIGKAPDCPGLDQAGPGSED
jgi:hypothetical protein